MALTLPASASPADDTSCPRATEAIFTRYMLRRTESLRLFTYIDGQAWAYLPLRRRRCHGAVMPIKMSRKRRSGAAQAIISCIIILSRRRNISFALRKRAWRDGYDMMMSRA